MFRRRLSSSAARREVGVSAAVGEVGDMESEWCSVEAEGGSAGAAGYEFAYEVVGFETSKACGRPVLMEAEGRKDVMLA